MSNKANLVFLCTAIMASLRPTHCRPDLHVHLSVVPDPMCSGPYHSHSISCNTDTCLSPVHHVTSLTVLASQGHLKDDEFTRIAAVERGKSAPQAFVSSKQYVLSGNIGTGNDSISQLVFSWESPVVREVKRYKCTVEGVDTSGRDVTISVFAEAPTGGFCGNQDNVTIVDPDTVCVPEKCGPNLINRAELEASTQTILHEVANLTSELGRSTKKVNTDFEALHLKVVMLDQKVVVQTSTIKDIQGMVASFIELYKYTYLTSNFDVLGIFRGTRYYVSKTEAAFNIRAADGQCSRLDGHLVEIDDRAEYNFVVKKLNKVSGNHFFTGGNDLKKEKDWRFFYSNRPISFTKWHESQPDNYRGNEDCLEIRKDLGDYDYNDNSCTFTGKFICEDLQIESEQNL
ncbi:perlucin C protein [Elysia marginata]|uniref:Perlucin C protein n=1 Tax=Elysia marginata TaxID=1093978 RepID=A0AAV4FF04_9GAST|nr:perlucin C protein [Elysia marginata]